jgi:hypothetical protein
MHLQEAPLYPYFSFLVIYFYFPGRHTGSKLIGPAIVNR